LGSFPLPVEVIPYGWKQVQRHIAGFYNIPVSLRMKEEKIFISDHGHYILDCRFTKIKKPEIIAAELNALPGVVENGLFIKMASIAIIAGPAGNIQTLSV
jgi:ribose 5-phosphate isomerase A